MTAETPGARQAVLRYRRLSASADGALLEIEPETGRMHQIRVQAATRGWPVRGDFLYGARLPFGPPAELPRDRIIALHAQPDVPAPDPLRAADGDGADAGGVAGVDSRCRYNRAAIVRE